MRTFAKLFGRSPFEPLQGHMDKVADCVDLVVEAVGAFLAGEHDKVAELAKEISKLEHKADLVKNDIRNHVPKRLFLPVDRAELMNILTIQDRIADNAENIAVLLTFKPICFPDALREHFGNLLGKNIEAFSAARLIIHELDELLEYSFGGPEAEKVKRLVDQVALKEHEADLIQRDLLKELFALDETLSPGTFALCMKIFEQVSDLANLSENLANAVRITLERK